MALIALALAGAIVLAAAVIAVIALLVRDR